MQKKNGSNIFYIIIAAISATALMRKYEPGIFEFKDVWASVIYCMYLLGFIFSIIGLLLGLKKRNDQSDSWPNSK